MKRTALLLMVLMTSSLSAGTLPHYGAQSMIEPLVKVLVKKPNAAFAEADPQVWHYTDSPDLARAESEHDAFVHTLKEEGVLVVYDEHELPEHADSIFVHDPVLITNHGAILLNMGKKLRRGEEEALEETLEREGVPVLARMTAPGTAEGGDTLWLDEKTLCVGRSYRTNSEGIRQLKAALEPHGVEVLAFDLPHADGEEACLHLQSFVSLVDRGLAVVYLKQAPVAFVQLLKKRGFRIIEVPEEEYLTMGPNILCIRPGTVLTIEGNPVTKQRMEKNGVRVLTYKGAEISAKAEGGATCLTRPILRSSRVGA